MVVLIVGFVAIGFIGILAGMATTTLSRVVLVTSACLMPIIHAGLYQSPFDNVLATEAVAILALNLGLAAGGLIVQFAATTRYPLNS